MLRLILTLSFVTMATTIAWGQSAGRHYWTKTVLATNSTCKLRIGDGVLSPGESNCTYSGHISINTQLLLRSVRTSGTWSRLELKDELDRSFILEISNLNKVSFRKTFGDLFAEESSDEYASTCNGNLLRDFLFSVGFPDQLSRKGKTERWSLSPNHFSVQSCGFDMADLKFVGGNLESLTGSI
jgi:hypothetical protein